jgi:predicted nucleic acid-binding protein
MKYSLDSNVLIDYQLGYLPPAGRNFVEEIIFSSFTISIVVKLEVLGYADSPTATAHMENLLSYARIIPLTEGSICTRTIALRRIFSKTKLWDMIIAATSLEYDLTLVTHNISDFKNVPDLLILNPYTLDLLPPSS